MLGISVIWPLNCTSVHHLYALLPPFDGMLHMYEWQYMRTGVECFASTGVHCWCIIFLHARHFSLHINVYLFFSPVRPPYICQHRLAGQKRIGYLGVRLYRSICRVCFCLRVSVVLLPFSFVSAHIGTWCKICVECGERCAPAHWLSQAATRKGKTPLKHYTIPGRYLCARWGNNK